MYHPKIIEQRLTQQVEVFRRQVPGFTPDRHSIAECQAWLQRLAGSYGPDGRQSRPWTTEETQFILSELTHCKADFTYWVSRWAKIRSEGGTLITVPLRRTQQIILRELGKLEATAQERRDGVLAFVLKARQLGCSTLAELLITHKAMFYANRHCLIASDVPVSSGHLFDMVERVFDNVPLWLRPRRTEHVKNEEMVFGDLDSKIQVGWGNASRGQKGAARARLAQGSTIHAIHCSELSTWNQPQQLDSSVDPALPTHMNTFGLYEGTALGRGNWVHEKWQSSVAGRGRFGPIFIPWCVEVEKYSAPAPEGWEPTSLTLSMADKLHRTMQEWCGINMKLVKDQLYWYEQKREDYSLRRQLHAFLAEFASDPEEAFQNSGVSAFSPETLSRLRQEAKPLAGLAEVRMDPTIDWSVPA